MKKLHLLAMTACATILAFLSLIWSFPVAAQGQSGTTLTAYKTATAHLVRTYHWTIDKSVSPDTWDLFKGDSGTSTYTVAVTKDSGTLVGYVDGQICVTNGGAVATQGLQIIDNVTMPPSSTVIASVNVDTSAHPVLQPGESYCYDYHVDIPAGSITPGANYKDTADITITNHSGHLGTPFGPGPSATSVMPSTPTTVNDTINVDDTNGSSWAFSASDSVSYDKTFSCNGDEGTHNNTATIRETGDKDSASVTVNCYELSVSKTAGTSFTRTWNWTIDKTSDQSSLTLSLGQSFIVNYSVKVDATSADSNFAVSGSISVDNPAPSAATLNSVSDVLPGSSNMAVDCAVSFPYTLVAGGTLNCTYSARLPDNTSRTNTATATLQNYSYDSSNQATASGTTDFSGSAGVSFASATMTKVHECVDVTDSFKGSLGSVCANDAPKTFTYSRTVGAYGTCGEYQVDNTATFTDPKDTSYTGSDSVTIPVHVPCVGGCTLTIGYWKTHAGFTGNNADMVSSKLPIWLGTSGGAKSIQVTTASQAVTLLNMNGDASNGINKLYAQLLGAKLNIASGASDSAVASTISAADTFLAQYNAANWSTLTKQQKAQVLGWATTLDNYNNGVIGPGHCSQ